MQKKEKQLSFLEERIFVLKCFLVFAFSVKLVQLLWIGSIVGTCGEVIVTFPSHHHPQS